MDKYMKNSLPYTLLQKLVAIPTITGHAATKEALGFVANFLTERGMHVHHREYGGCPALVATSRPTKTPAIMLVGHIDVVPGPKELFKIREADGRLYGRGTMDMKAAIAAYLCVVDALKSNLDDYDFGLMITSDEEQHGPSVGNLLDEGFKPKAAVLFDGAANWEIESATKGAWCPLITVTGKRAHGSRPWLGDSASLKLIGLLNEIQTLFDNSDHDGNTLNISAIECGAIGMAPNQVPAHAQATLDIRVINTPELHRIQRFVRNLCAKYDATCEEFIFFPPIAHDLTNPYIATFKDVLQRVTGVESDGYLSLAVSDAVCFSERDIPCAVTYPRGGNHHGDDEWVSRDAPELLIEIVKDFLAQTARALPAAELDEALEAAVA
jgi:succinyl-diaminopimelate desuccinylase